MAGKSAAPLILGLGAAALVLSGKKKKKSSSSSSAQDEKGEIIVDTVGEKMEGAFDPAAENAYLVLDQECMEIAHKINPSAHNTYITNRFHQLLSEGWDDMSQITIRLLQDQSKHCPWSDTSKWTPMMNGLYEQLLAAVTGYHEALTGTPANTGA